MVARESQVANEAGYSIAWAGADNNHDGERTKGNMNTNGIDSRSYCKVAGAALVLLLFSPGLMGQQVATLVRKVTPPSWMGTNVLWSRDVQPHNKIDDTIDSSTNTVFDVVVNFRSCPSGSDISTLNSFSTNQTQLTYLSSIALGNVAKTNITLIAAMTNVAFIEQQLGFATNLTISVPSI